MLPYPALGTFRTSKRLPTGLEHSCSPRSNISIKNRTASLNISNRQSCSRTLCSAQLRTAFSPVSVYCDWCYSWTWLARCQYTVTGVIWWTWLAQCQYTVTSVIRWTWLAWCQYTVTNCILFCSTPELDALAPFVFEVCGLFYTCGVWPWHWFCFGFTSYSSCPRISRGPRVPRAPLFHVFLCSTCRERSASQLAIGSPEYRRIQRRL